MMATEEVEALAKTWATDPVFQALDREIILEIARENGHNDVRRETSDRRSPDYAWLSPLFVGC